MLLTLKRICKRFVTNPPIALPATDVRRTSLWLLTSDLALSLDGGITIAFFHYYSYPPAEPDGSNNHVNSWMNVFPTPSQGDPGDC